ncbi:MAG: hypothetical protein EOP43_06795 [Sphingobacteriaceae bacterium]|nr:MAG: hypothetical protein EOP43_06795 [Sphingobacteriaceae bacterium]
MKLKLLLLTILFLSIYQTKAQVKFGAKSGIGVFFEFFDYNILAPSIERDAPTKSLYGNSIPRKSPHIYTSLAQQHEIFAAYRKNIFKLNVAFASADAPYEDLLERFWGNNESHKYIHYTLGYGYKISDKKHYDMDIQSGIIVEKFLVVRTVYDVAEIDGKYYAVNPSINKPGKGASQFDWGFPVEVNANYKISEHAAVGLQAKTSYILGLGVQWLYLMPMVKVQF